MGGTGASLGFLIAILIFSKSGEKKVAKYAIAGSVFQINEPVIFGIPIVLNITYFIPFVFIQPILLLIT
jgi:PTS system cellobiose-specific IIC component